MAQRTASTVRASSRSGLIKSFLLMALFVAIAASIVGELFTGISFGLLGFVFYRLVIVRHIICRHHRKGVWLTRVGRFEQAIEVFRVSERKWAGRRWLDNARGFLLGSAGPWPYLWLARYNQAYCLARLGRGTEALEQLDAIVQQRPDMRLARELRDAMRAGLQAPSAHSTPADAPPADHTWGGMVDPPEAPH